MQKTYYPKAADIQQDWFVVDATSQTLGRLASKIAHVLLGKHKPSFTPGVDLGDNIIVINAEKITVTGMKMTDKYYYHYSGYPSGMKSISLQDQLSKHPDRVIRRAVWGMLPHNRHGRQLIKKLKIYQGAEHPHAAQQPKPLV